jgi:septal ring factor EnvC (AmiA/AmiB activator)
MALHRTGRGAALLVLIALALASCGSPGALDDAAQDQIDEARSEAQAATEVAAALTTRLSRLENRLAAASEDRAEVAKQLDKISSRLEYSIAHFTKQVKALRSGSSEARANAEAALAEALQAARDLAVLERRFDYHLKQGG